MDIPVGYSQVNFIYNALNWREPPQVTLGLRNVPGNSPAAIATDIATPWTTHLPGVTSDQLTLYKLRVKNGPVTTGPFFELSVGVAGTVASQAMPNQAAVLMRKYTARGGRKGRGRSFWPGVTEGQSDGAGLLKDAEVVNWQSAVQDLYDDIVTAGYQPVLLHTSSADAPDDITQVVVEQLMATQRRRLRKVPRKRAA